MATIAQTQELRDMVRANIHANSRADSTYITMNVLATVIACYGLLENSAAVVIGAMLIAMLLGPISGIALSLVEGDNRHLRTAVVALAVGVGAVYSTAFVFGLLHRVFPLTGEIYVRTAPNLMDLMIALAAGAAGASGMTTGRLDLVVVGVAIATALVPPLSSSAICLARGEYRLSAGAMLLVVANMVGIQTASSVVMWLRGYRGHVAAMQPGRLIKRSMASVVALAGLAIALTINLRRLIGNEIYEASVRSVLTVEATKHQGVYLADLRFRHDVGHAVITAVYRTPVPFTPGQVGLIEQELPRHGDESPELRIRSIPVTVASREGYLYSDEAVGDVLGR